METLGVTASDIMRSAVGACQTPVIILLLLSLALTVALIGTLLGEAISERRHFKVFLPQLLEDLKGARSAQEARSIVQESGLLMRQKQYLVEIASHPDVTPEMRESLAAALEYREQRRYDRIVRVSDLVSRIAPMLGLLGTLIPLAPGIMALGEGNVEVLSSSLLTAFDTTSLGLIIAGFALVISAIRKGWYKDYMVAFDSSIEMLLEIERHHFNVPAAVEGTCEAGELR